MPELDATSREERKFTGTLTISGKRQKLLRSGIWYQRVVWSVVGPKQQQICLKLNLYPLALVPQNVAVVPTFSILTPSLLLRHFAIFWV